MRKNRATSMQINKKISPKIFSYPLSENFPLFFCTNKEYINDLQKEANILLVYSLTKYRKLFYKKFKQDLLDYLSVKKFLTDGWYYFDLYKFERFAKKQGYDGKKENLQEWVEKKYGKKTKNMIEDMIFKAVELAEKNSCELK